MSKAKLLVTTPAKGLQAQPAHPAPATQDAKIVERAVAHCMELLQARANQNYPRDNFGSTPPPVRDGQFLRGDDLDRWWDQAAGQQSLTEVWMGIALLSKRAEVQLHHGMHSAWYEARGLSAQRAAHFMNLARFFGNHHRPVLEQVVKLQAHVQRQIATLPPEIVDQIAVDGTLDEMQEMTQAEALKTVAAIKSLNKRLAQRDKELDAYDRQEEERRARQREYYPSSVDHARVQGTARALAITASMDAIERLALNLIEGRDLATDPGERHMQLRAGVAPLYVTLRGAIARAQQVLETLHENLEGFLPEGGIAPLASVELMEAKDALRVMLIDPPGTPRPAATPAKRGPKPGSRRRAG